MGGPLLKVSFQGSQEVQAFLKSRRKVLEPAMRAGLYQIGCAVISDSIPRAPKDTGTLRNSAYCELPKGSPKDMTVTGGYGGFAKAYALVQHENLSYRHLEGSAKYLEKAFRKIGANAAQYLAGIIGAAFTTKSAPPMANMGVPTMPGPMSSQKPRKRAGSKKVKPTSGARKLIKKAKRVVKRGLRRLKGRGGKKKR